MKVLLLGVTGNVGARLLPALTARKHEVVAYVRSPNKISPEAKSNLSGIVTGSAADSTAIKAAILSHNCDAVVNAAGLAAMTSWHSQGEFPSIFAAVVKAAAEAGRERGGTPLRCWMMSGFTIMDSLKKPYLLVDYVPLFPIHKKNYDLIETYSSDNLAWSLFCANQMYPKHDPPLFPPSADTGAENVVVKAEAPPDWANKYAKVPLIGGYLNVMAQSTSYFALLENCVDVIAKDLEEGLDSELIGKRVAVKEKEKIK